MIIKLSPREIGLCRRAASFRWQLARASGIKNQRLDAYRSDDDLDYLGLRSELAVSKAFNIDNNLFELGKDDGSDLWLDEISVDVKATFYRTGKLIFRSLESFKSHCSVLVCQHSENELFIAGYISRKIFLEQSYKKDLGHGISFVLDQEDLKPISHLWEVSVKQRQK